MNQYIVSRYVKNKWKPIKVLLASNADNAIFIVKKLYGYVNVKLKAELYS